MSVFLYADDEEATSKVNIDDLFERKQVRDLKQLSIFNKILARCQKRIQLTGRNKRNDQHIWFQIPAYIFGEPVYDVGDCIAYIVMKLENNGFHVRYLHPNTIFVDWKSYVPSYVRTEYKKKTGKIMDERGGITDPKKEEATEEEEVQATKTLQPPRKQFTPIANYKPTGKFMYDTTMMESLEKKLG
jgi:hypothetical protein|uniref:Uncharacterized protein n=1 Tax=viral metagenome TaxID=1070528 RepID=A0A6C0HIA6_9ZZZZ